MFNEELKLKYIIDYTKDETYSKSIKSILNNIGKYESKLGIDVSEFNIEQIAEMMSVAPTSTSVFINYKSVLVNYLKWAKNSGIKINASIEDVSNIKENFLNKIHDEMVSNPLMLQKWLNLVFDNEKDGTTDIVYRCYYWLAFSGMPERFAMTITEDNLNFDNAVINIDGKFYPLYRESYITFKECINRDSFVYKHPLYKEDIIRKRVDSKQLLRGVRGEQTPKIIMAAIKNRFKSISTNTNVELYDYKSIMMSGIFYNIYEREVDGAPIVFDSIASQIYDDAKPEIDNTDKRKRGIRTLKAQLSKNYYTWKEAFNY